MRKKSTLTGLALINARFEKEQNLQRYTEEDFKRVFKHFDKDQNGHIDADELQEVLNELAGCAVRGTSSTACWGVSLVAPRFTFLSCFFLFFCLQDGDKDAVPKERVKHMLDKYDTDRNGTIEENEFIDMMKGTIQDIDMDAQILEAFKIFADKARLLEEVYTLMPVEFEVDLS